MDCDVKNQNKQLFISIYKHFIFFHVQFGLLVPSHTIAVSFITLCFRSIGMDCVISEFCYKRDNFTKEWLENDYFTKEVLEI